MSAIEARVHRAISGLESGSRQTLQELVRIPSPSGHERDVQRWVARRMADLGLAVDSFDIDPSAMARVPGFNDTPRPYADRPCVVGVLRGVGGGRSLILNAHADTAPVEEPSSWSRPPYSGEIVDGRLYGRGAWDDKAGIAEMLLVVEALRLAGVRLRGDLILKSVVEDETTGNGTLACLARGYTADGAIIVDGTWPERYIVSHLGHVWFRITLHGATGHAAARGGNPVDAIGPVVAALRQMVAHQNQGRTGEGDFADRPAFINFGQVDGGVWPGAIPGRCTIDGTYGFPPPDDRQTAHARLTAAIDAVTAMPGWSLETAPALSYPGFDVPPLVNPSVNEITTLLSGTIERLHGGRLTEHVVAGCCDLRHYTSGRPQPAIPACLYGPGGGKGAHATDEYFLLEHLPVVARTLASTAIRWCGVA